MSMGHYRVVSGKLIVAARQSPDGDSMRFVPDDISHLEDLPHYRAPRESDSHQSFQLRFQAIDTPELHYAGACQPFGLEARDGLLDWLGIDHSTWDWVVAPKDFYHEMPAQILCDGFESHGRPISFVFLDAPGKDGSEIKLTKRILQQSFNHHAAKAGLAYLGLYAGGLSPDIRATMVEAYLGAKHDELGLWKLDESTQFKVETLEDLTQGRGTLIYPKIFRRCVDGLRWANGVFEPGLDLDDFLQSTPRENDAVHVADHAGHVLKLHLSDLVVQENNEVRITTDLNQVDFVSK